MKHYDVYGIGQAILDTEYEVSDSLLNRFRIPKGQMTRLAEADHRALVCELENHCRPTYCSCGGSVANSVVTIRSLGGGAYYSGTVAKDLAGRKFLNALAQCGVGYNQNAMLDDQLTGQCVVMLTPDSERSMNTFLGAAAAVCDEHIDYAALEQSQVLFIEGYIASCPNSVAAALSATAFHRQQGGQVALTFSDPVMVKVHKATLALLIGEGLDLIFCNEQEAALWSSRGNYAEGIKALMRYTRVLVVTRGAQGACIYSENQCIDIPAETVTAINTNGAGDNFAGAFLYARTQGYNLADSGRIAAHTAAIAVSQNGPRLTSDQYRAIGYRFASGSASVAL